MIFSETKKEVIPPHSHPLDPRRRNTPGNTAFAISPNHSSLPIPVKGIHRRTCDLDDLLDIMHICLKGYQSYFEIVEGKDPWIVNFPFAWKLDPGDSVFNLTKNSVYTIDSYVNERDSKQIVKLTSGSNGLAPDKTDVLSLDFDNGQLLNFQEAYPDSDDTKRFFSDEEIAKNSTEPLVDTITYQYSLRPHERSRASSGIDNKQRAIAQINDSLRDQTIDKEEGTVKNVFGNLLQVELCFTCWTATQGRSAALAKWFRIFMRRYRPILCANGAVQIWFVEQKKSLNTDRWRNDIIGRSLDFGALIEEQYETHDAILRSFESYLVTSNRREAEQITSSIDTENKEVNNG